MGLDMYLNASRFLWHNEKPLSDAVKSAIGLEQNMEVKEIELRAAYWRKANAIHQWFVENVQSGVDECQEHDVSREQLTALRDTCQRVLDDPAKGPTLLPTQSGFFFGGTEYDDDYLHDIRDTIKQIDEALTLPDCWSFTYRSSW